jgi:hypothetical protein
MKTQPESLADDAVGHWRWKTGWIALATCALCAEGVLAGAARSCMPWFSPVILFYWVLQGNALGVAEAASILAGVPAFIFAAYPSSFGVRKRRFGTFAAILLVGACVAVAAWMTVQWGPTLQVPIVLVPVIGAIIGALVGFATRAFHGFESRWLPIAMVAALSIAVIIFSFGHYGVGDYWRNCWCC